MSDNIPTPETDAVIRNIVDEFPLNGGHEVWFERFHALQDFTLALERRLIEAQKDWRIKRDELIHKRFFFQPHPDDKDKCNCAYCARDFEAVAEHCAYMEMDLHSIKGQLDEALAKVEELAKRIEMLTQPRPMN